MNPNLIIIGSQKCGTSSLHHYLSIHPDVSMSTQKELDFFVEHRNWPNGIDWYQSQFTGTSKIHGESSPSYTMYPHLAGVPRRMHSLVPDARLIYLVRDPVERIVSHYLHQWYAKHQDAAFLDILDDPDDAKTRHYINTSSYYLQLSQYLEFYDLPQIHVTSLEALKTSPKDTLGEIFRFLQIDDTFFPSESTKVVNQTRTKMRTNKFGKLLRSNAPLLRPVRRQTGRLLPASAKSWIRSLMGSRQDRPELDPQLRQTLHTALQDDIARFRELTGQPFDDWSL